MFEGNQRAAPMAREGGPGRVRADPMPWEGGPGGRSDSPPPQAAEENLWNL